MTQQQKLAAIIQKLESDKFSAVTIYDTATNNAIVINKSGEALKAEFGGVNQFFENLIAQKKHYVSIQERRQNGTHNGRINYKSIGEPQEFIIGVPQSKQQVMTSQSAQVFPARPVYPNEPVSGLNGVVSLGVPEVVRLNVSEHEKVRLETENYYLKDKIERLEKDIAEYKEREIQSKISDSRANNQTEIIKHALPLLAPVFEKFLGGSASASAGMNAPTPQLQESTISEAKQGLLSLTEPMAEFLYGIYTKVSTEEAFYKDLDDLLKKHDSTENGNNNPD